MIAKNYDWSCCKNLINVISITFYIVCTLANYRYRSFGLYFFLLYLKSFSRYRFKYMIEGDFLPTGRQILIMAVMR